MAWKAFIQPWLSAAARAPVVPTARSSTTPYMPGGTTLRVASSVTRRKRISVGMFQTKSGSLAAERARTSDLKASSAANTLEIGTKYAEKMALLKIREVLSPLFKMVIKPSLTTLSATNRFTSSRAAGIKSDAGRAEGMSAAVGMPHRPIDSKTGAWTEKSGCSGASVTSALS
eukprot:scaffold20513_cov62-Phaeocystis_antarctica.AAC.6